MIPYIETKHGNISTFVIFIIIGILSLLLCIHITLQKATDSQKEENYIIPKIITSGFIAYFSAGFLDSLFKYFEYGVFKISGITFYGGFLAAVISLYIQLKLHTDTQYSINQWFNLLTQPFLLFHFFGRIGCFFAGCCYGKTTENVFGVSFPDNIELGFIHNGLKCYPTQLFEAIIILLIFVILIFVKQKFRIYLFCYSISRFLLEFLRADDRGYISNYFSPAQVISLTIMLIYFLTFIRRNKIIKVK